MQFTENIIQESTKPIIIMAYASWCPHCAAMKPIFHDLEDELKQYQFTEFDVDAFVALAQQLNVNYLPTFIFIKNKAEVGRGVGEMPKDELKETIEKYLGS